MSKVNVSGSQSTAPKADDPSTTQSSQPKTDFGEMLAKKNADNQANQVQQNAARGAAENAARGAARNAAQNGAKNAAQAGMRGAQMSAAATGKQGKMSMAGGPASRPMVQNPHMAKLQKAAKQFDQQLAKAQKADEGTKQTLGDIRTEAKAGDALRNTHRSNDTAKAEVRTEVARQEHAERGAEARARGDAQQLSNAQMNRVRDRQRDALQASIGAVGETARQGAAAKVKETSKAQQIPEELLEQLVEEVRVGVNEAGHAEFQIDLKDGVLQGMTMKISADGGKVSCTFIGGDAGAKNFIESSEGALARALEGKGLQLSRLEVQTA